MPMGLLSDFSRLIPPQLKPHRQRVLARLAIARQAVHPLFPPPVRMAVRLMPNPPLRLWL
jgi:hypothetical protein